jgi:hypothetical protein
LPPSAIAGVSVVCALGPWVFSEATVLRALAAAAAATALIGAFVMRRWDIHAGKQVADLTRARASDEWRFDERLAELEADLEESRELRAKLEQRLRAKRAELAGLRNEHAALLRRYATAETERASALEGRRLLEIEAAAPSSSPALPPARSAEPEPAEKTEQTDAASGDAPKACAVFSPEGAELYRRALTALARFDRDAESGPADESGASEPGTAEAGPDAKGAKGAKGEGRADAVTSEGQTDAPSAEAEDPADAEEGDEQAPPAAVDEHARAAAPSPPAEQPAKPVGQQPSGHFTVPTAVAVVPAPARRPVVEGGFDFFGTQKGTPKTALDSVQNEDLADVVGQEALALHKAEAEAEFKPADERSRGVGQVIDLTAHDETEQIDVQGLRSAAS